MAKITISNISIKNLGPFRELQTIDLTVKGIQRPVILVKALNGSGKTTLLTALQIGLYGIKAISDQRRSEYEQLLLSLQRRDAVGNSAVEIGVTVETAGVRRQLSVLREWNPRSDGLIEELTVFENGSKDLDFSQNWEEFIGSVLPPELVQLFLFDGEKIEALANPDRLPDLLKRATEVFLGIGGIESLTNDLRALERRTSLKNKSGSAEFEAAQTTLKTWETQAKELEKKLQILTQEQASAKNVAEHAQTTLSKFSADAQRQGLAAYEKAAAIRNFVEVARKTTETTRTDLADAMSDPVLPIAWLSDLWLQYRASWESDQYARHAKLLNDEFKKRDKRVLSSLPSSISRATTESLRKIFTDDRRAFYSSNSSVHVELQDAPPRDIERYLDESKLRLGKGLNAFNTSRIELDRAEQQIGQIPAEEQIAEILETLQKHAKIVSLAEAKLTDISEKTVEASNQLSHVLMRLNAAQERMGTEFRDRSLEAKGLEASARARKSLVLFKERLLASKAQWLSEMITTEFRNLLRKRNLITEVLVDPVTYRVSIKDGKHQELPMDRLSAGERQLLAISVLSALIKERKGRFPVVVDTPLARLDQQHRSALIKRFFGTVSHQVVVLSTDQEVEGDAYDTLKPYLSAEYSLDFDDLENRTLINKRLEQEIK